MAWQNLKEDLEDLFSQTQRQEEAAEVYEIFRSTELATQKAAKRRYTLKQLRLRLVNRAPIVCGNPVCGAVFVAYRKDTLYCTKLCRWSFLNKQAYQKRVARRAQSVSITT